MKFNRKQHDEHLDISFIPLIDVLLVIVIFLAASSSFTKLNQIEVRLPEATQTTPLDKTNDITAVLTSSNELIINKINVLGSTPADIAQVFGRFITPELKNKVTLYADGQSSHQAVIDVMEGARMAGINSIHFATQAHVN